MRQYSLTPQEEKNYCVPSCLQAILRNYNIEETQREIFQQLTPTEKGVLISDDKFKNLLSIFEFNYDFFLYNQTPFNEPDFLLNKNSDKDILIGINEHCYILVLFQDPKLHVIDPKDAIIKEDELPNILNKMRKTKSGGFGLISKF